ncbi:DUF1190 domain-containing protein [Roseomonas sp. HJA6]|uniref:DUF1190 domain-containing protein n=1 Tax=Roseomonas alba TaxID=2846776 RepID=A0ABS7AI56_9PROT|nr:DUF1190 domain-containing protein [Neoroseomonas alba]
MRRRSRTVRAAALVTIGLGVTGCDDAPPDLPGQTEARLDACRAAHRRLGEDPARCDVLEQVIAREQTADRPQFRTIAACEATFGRDACEGETLAATGPNWRPALAGWVPSPGNPQILQPVLRDRSAQYWALSEPVRPATGTLLTQNAPRNVPGPALAATARSPAATQYAYYHLAPIYPDEASCGAEWQSCERSDAPLPNRFATEEACKASWSQCLEVELPESALTMAVATAPQQGSTGPGTTGGTGSGGGVHPAWWIGYNSGYRSSYAGGIGPRYQGWTWTGDRRPTAAYRPATGTGPLQAWDSSTRRLGAASRMASYSGGTSARTSGTSISRPASSISRAGFGSTGSAYSSGG